MGASPEPLGSDRTGIVAAVALVACCAIPMLAVLGLTAIVGVSLGWSAALVIGVIVGGACLVGAAAHHRTGGPHVPGKAHRD